MIYSGSPRLAIGQAVVAPEASVRWQRACAAMGRAEGAAMAC
jgi:hypothetical protein